jgi:hypothetical protein
MTTHKHRSQTQWIALINQQQESGLTASQFCRQHDLNPQYFSKRKRQLSLKAASSSDAPLFIKLKQPSRPTPGASESRIMLSYQGIQLQLSTDVEPQWLAHLMSALS